MVHGAHENLDVTDPVHADGRIWAGMAAEWELAISEYVISDLLEHSYH